MSFNINQLRKLKASIRPQYIKQREVDGKTLNYLEGWYIISEANRIFGFDGWDRETISSQCVWQKQIQSGFTCSYLTKVKIIVRAGERLIQREGLGSGEAVALTPGQAHERASKSAETDATKRALSTFGNPFGLSLYRDKTELPKQKQARPLQLRRSNSTQELIKNQESITTNSNDLDKLDIPESSRPIMNPEPIVSIEKNTTINDRTHNVQMRTLEVSLKVEKSALAIGEPKRFRSRHHLRFVASQACLICGRTPSQAHHLRFSQPRAMGRKVSDEYTVPLCATHHYELHSKGNESEWWEQWRIEPLKIAQDLWVAQINHDP